MVSNYNNKAIKSRSSIKMRINGFRDRNYSLCVNGEGVIVGRGNRFGSKMNYVLIPFNEINNIEYKDLWGKGEIKIKTKDDKFKAQGLVPSSAIGFLNFVEKVLSGDKDILNGFDQDIRADEIPIYSTSINKNYVEYGIISARADSSLLSKTATMDDVNARLREEAVRLNANAIINAQYDRTSLTSWRGIKATGEAVYIQSDEKKCPFCAEMIRNEAIKCKHCLSDLSIPQTQID